MSTSISAVYSVPSAFVRSPILAATPATTPGTPAVQIPEEDTVTLSTSAQVDQLDQQGASPDQIAQSLGLSVDLVDLDLGIVSATPSVSSSSAQPAEVTPATSASVAPSTGASLITGTKSASAPAATAPTATPASVATTAQTIPTPATTNVFA